MPGPERPRLLVRPCSIDSVGRPPRVEKLIDERDRDEADNVQLERDHRRFECHGGSGPGCHATVADQYHRLAAPFPEQVVQGAFFRAAL